MKINEEVDDKLKAKDIIKFCLGIFIILNIIQWICWGAVVIANSDTQIPIWKSYLIGWIGPISMIIILYLWHLASELMGFD